MMNPVTTVRASLVPLESPRPVNAPAISCGLVRARQGSSSELPHVQSGVKRKMYSPSDGPSPTWLSRKL